MISKLRGLFFRRSAHLMAGVCLQEKLNNRLRCNILFASFLVPSVLQLCSADGRIFQSYIRVRNFSGHTSPEVKGPRTAAEALIHCQGCIW